MDAAHTHQIQTRGLLLKQLKVLFKVRIVGLLMVASLAGMFIAVEELPSLGTIGLLLATGALSAGGASALNQLLERRSDANMRRTRNRPLVDGSLDYQVVAWIAVAMVAGAVLWAAVYNLLLAVYLLIGALIYVGIYTLWLKPRTMLNIVIGGAAGSCAVMAGGAAVHTAASPQVIALALIMFLWTPGHFWTLAFAYREDYQKAGIPMLPVSIMGVTLHIVLSFHLFATVITSLVLAITVGWISSFIMGLLGTGLLIRYYRFAKETSKEASLKVFLFTNIFMLILLLSLSVEKIGKILWA